MWIIIGMTNNNKTPGEIDNNLETFDNNNELQLLEIDGIKDYDWSAFTTLGSHWKTTEIIVIN